ncbi:MAG: hypothetical protein Q4G26_03790 [Paracoccus sp. (in: a-proteobacteria)]|nr:hypothetical protein [Paracoccus sp. (in: a-proteobacteria)]
MTISEYGGDCGGASALIRAISAIQTVANLDRCFKQEKACPVSIRQAFS